MVQFPFKRTWENEKFMTTLMGSRYSLKDLRLLRIY